MRTGAFLYPTGYHIAAWRHPAVPADGGVNAAGLFRLARQAERGLFDFVFLADSLALRGTDLEVLGRSALRYVGQVEPMTLLAAFASITRHIGLVGSATTTYNHPYHVARMFASLDHLSRGRAGWNLVTSSNPDEASNFGLDRHPVHSERYARAREFLKVVLGLWDSWDDDAFVRDKGRGVFFDPGRVRVLNHVGTEFKVRGPLNVPRTPQGRPVIVQSGASEPGRDLAGAFAEVVFAAHTRFEDARAFYDDVKRRAREHGRRSTDIVVMPGIFPFVGRSRAEAEEKRERLRSLIDPVVGLSLLGGLMADRDLSSLALDEPISQMPTSEGLKSRQALVLEMALRERLTLRELYLRVAESRGHWLVVGTAADIADQMEHWFRNGAADGFNVMSPTLPIDLADFVRLVVPELQRRGLWRTAYNGPTLRDNLALPWLAGATMARAHRPRESRS